MRPLLALMLLLACSSPQEGEPAAPPGATPAPAPATATTGKAAPPLRLEARYRVSWGYGCGGNCAQNTRGESAVVVTAEGSRLRMKDAGEITTTHASPGSLVTEKRLWSFGGYGELTRATGSMTLGLSQLDGHCKDSQDSGTGARFEPCKHRPPGRLTIGCTRDEVDADGAKRPVWRCEPDPPIPGGEWSGTPFPWIFGIDEPIDTIHAGEPEPRTRYQLRPPG